MILTLAETFSRLPEDVRLNCTVKDYYQLQVKASINMKDK